VSASVRVKFAARSRTTRERFIMLTDYEQRREARIARNREILLQLVGSLPAHQASPRSPKPSPEYSPIDR
jgi:hypothetical protein